MAIQHVLDDIYHQLGVPPPEGIGFTALPAVLADIYRHLGVPQPTGVPMQYVIEDIYRHLKAKGLPADARADAGAAPKKSHT